MRKVLITKSMPEHEAKRKLRALGRQKGNRKEDLSDLIGELKRYEKKFGMSTLEFYWKFCTGKMGDDMDVIKWAGLYKAYMILVQDLANPKATS